MIKCSTPYPSSLSQYSSSETVERISENRFVNQQADEKRRSLWDQAASDGLDDPAHEISSFYSLQDVPSEAAVEAESMSAERLDERQADEDQRSFAEPAIESESQETDRSAEQEADRERQELLDQEATPAFVDSPSSTSSSNVPQNVSSAAAVDSESEEANQSTKQETDQEQQSLSNQEATSAFVDSTSITFSSDPPQAVVDSENEETDWAIEQETDQEQSTLLDQEATAAFVDAASNTSSNAPQDDSSAAALEPESDETDQTTKQEADQEQPDLRSGS
ncbi:hypothetical protein MRB53_039864 [Persea americana]|nr:hypothetical protein MRB53_039864 [Persea americana]